MFIKLNVGGFIMSRIKTRRSREVNLNNEFERFKEIVVNEKKLLNLSRNTLKNYNKVFNALNDYFNNKVSQFDLTAQQAEEFVRYL